jgi:hypothetical protein
LKGEFEDSSVGFKLYYFGFIVAGFLLFAYLVRDFSLPRFPEVLLFVLIIVIADTAQPRSARRPDLRVEPPTGGDPPLGTVGRGPVEAIASFFSGV